MKKRTVWALTHDNMGQLLGAAEYRKRMEMRNGMARDTVLSTTTPEEIAEYFAGRAKLDPGTVWDGVFKPMLEAMDEESRAELLGEIENRAWRAPCAPVQNFL